MVLRLTDSRSRPIVPYSSLLLAVIWMSWFVPCDSDAQVLHWAHSLGLSGESQIDQVVTDARDNVYVLGTKNNSGSVDLDPGPGSAVFTWDFGGLPGSGRFLAKYDSSGIYQWGYRMDQARAIAVSPLGQVVVLANVQGSWDADPGPAAYLLTTPSGTGVARWNSDGEFLSGFVLPEAGSRHCCVDDQGRIFMTGNFTGTIDADPGPGIHALTSNGSADVFICRFNAQNELVWGRSFGGQGTEGPSDLLFHSGLIIVTLRTLGPIPIEQFDVDPGSEVALTELQQHEGTIMVEFDQNGSYIRHNSFNWISHWESPLVDALPDGGLVLGGSVLGSSSFVTNDTSFVHLASGNDGFLHRLYVDRQPGWVDMFSAYGNELLTSMITAKDGAILVCGMFTHTIDMDPGPLELIYSNSPPGDGWIGSYCMTDGSWIWSSLINGADRDLFGAMAWTESDALIIGGKASTDADLGLGGPEFLVSTPASSSAIVARYRDVATDCGQSGVGIHEMVLVDELLVIIVNGFMTVNSGSGEVVELYDTGGRLIRRGPLVHGNISMDVSDLSLGVYVVMVRSDNARLARRVMLD